MSALLIKTDLKSKKLLTEMAKRLGGNVVTLTDEQFEDLALGALMDKAKTGENVSREAVKKKLKRRAR
jgi:hypothetical protein